MISTTLLFLLVVISIDCQQLISPCPELLTIKDNAVQPGSWGATLKFNLDDHVIGLFLRIEMDTKINLITNNFQLTKTKDNQVFYIEDFNYKPTKKPVVIDMSVKYNSADPMPQIKKISLNGKLQCPKPEVPLIEVTTHKTIPFIEINEDDF